MNTLEDLKNFLHENLRRECDELFGLPDGPWIQRAVNNWFDDTQNYDRRFNVIAARRHRVGPILDVAAGCGTFMLHGLNRGFDLTGIEPESWKRRYFKEKIRLSNYSPRFIGRMIAAVGESLPFKDETFDLVTTFQTLEHVADVPQCLREMIRVLRPGGVLYLRAPNYNCFFEPHYRLPFLPKMRREWAERYLRFLNRPLAGLRTLNWTTESDIRAQLARHSPSLCIERNAAFFIERRRREIESKLPAFLRPLPVARALNEFHQLKRRAAAALKAGRQERVIDLWITKPASQSAPLSASASILAPQQELACAA